MRKRAYASPAESFEARTERRGECLIWTGGTGNKGYGLIWIDGRHEAVHRYAWKKENGPIPPGFDVDHRDHCDSRCVEVKHLRIATRAQNAANRAGANTKNLTGVRNVHRNRNKFRVRIRKLGELYDFGTYDTLEQAEVVAEMKRHELFGEFEGRG